MKWWKIFTVPIGIVFGLVIGVFMVQAMAFVFYIVFEVVTLGNTATYDPFADLIVSSMKVSAGLFVLAHITVDMVSSERFASFRMYRRRVWWQA